jgi:hypothetical protein
MVQIIVDTQKDSAHTIKQVITLLEQELQKKEPFTPPLTINQESNPKLPQEHPSFTDMFAEQEKPIIPQPTQPSSREDDLFSMFSGQLPSSAPKNVELDALPKGILAPTFEEEQPINNSQNNNTQENLLTEIDNLFLEKKSEPTDFEKSSRFSEFNQEPEKKDSSEKKQDFFKELEFYD